MEELGDAQIHRLSHANPDFSDIFPDFATTPEVETTDLSGPEE